MLIPSASFWTTLPYFSGSFLAKVVPVKRLGQVSSGLVMAGRLSGITWTRFFLVGMGVSVRWLVVKESKMKKKEEKIYPYGLTKREYRKGQLLGLFIFIIIVIVAASFS